MYELIDLIFRPGSLEEEYLAIEQTIDDQDLREIFYSRSRFWDYGKLIAHTACNLLS